MCNRRKSRTINLGILTINRSAKSVKIQTWTEKTLIKELGTLNQQARTEVPDQLEYNKKRAAQREIIYIYIYMTNISIVVVEIFPILKNGAILCV